MFASVSVSPSADASSAAGDASCLPSRKSGSRQGAPPLPRAISFAASRTGLCCVARALLSGSASGVAVRESRVERTRFRCVLSGLACQGVADGV